ncbi:MAG: hypothetical protein VX090_00910 [Pseudomonadota bacterium]|nr:hypothetical protein [Pseudomonadota bacterium]
MVFLTELLSEFDKFAVLAHIGNVYRHRHDIAQTSANFFHLLLHLTEDETDLRGEVAGKRSPGFVFRRQ